MAKRTHRLRKRKAGNGKGTKGRSTMDEGRKGTELQNADLFSFAEAKADQSAEALATPR